MLAERESLEPRVTKPAVSPLTTFFSRLIGIFAMLFALSLLTHEEATGETLTALVRNPPLLLIFGMVWLAAGLAIVLGHNIWSGGVLPVIVTLVGWLILIRGLLMLFLLPAAAVGLFAGLHFEDLSSIPCRLTALRYRFDLWRIPVNMKFSLSACALALAVLTGSATRQQSIDRGRQ
jgi:hypothetical protein